jgi:hypothetical protein
MKPDISKTKFGSITIDGKEFEHDIIIRLSGEIKKRKKKLSKAVYGTSHKISVDEVKYVYEKGVKRILIGTGHNDMVKLSDPALEFLKKKKCRIDLLPTVEAVRSWNRDTGKTIGLFHITC